MPDDADIVVVEPLVAGMPPGHGPALLSVKALLAIPRKSSDLRVKMTPQSALLLPVLPAAWQTSCACKSTGLKCCQSGFPPDINAGFRVNCLGFRV